MVWQLRYDLIAVVLVAIGMTLMAPMLSLQDASAIVPLLGVVVSIFIGFRNSNAFSRWWEARTLWGTVVGNCRAFENGLVAVDDCSPDMAVATDRMRRRQVRHAWQLAAELRRHPVAPEVRELTPEDPPEATAGFLLTLQAADTRDLKRAGRIDPQGRVILTNLNTAEVMAAGGLERIRNQSIPQYYALFVRSLAWFFGILVCTRVDANGHHTVRGVVLGIVVMTLFVVAERMGALAEKPLGDSPFALPMNDFCAGITADLLGPEHPLATGLPTVHPNETKVRTP